MAKKSKEKRGSKRGTRIRHWTKDEKKSLRTGVKSGLKAPEIAAALKRTEGAVRQMAFAMELSFRRAGLKARKKAA